MICGGLKTWRVKPEWWNFTSSTTSHRYATRSRQYSVEPYSLDFFSCKLYDRTDCTCMGGGTRVKCRTAMLPAGQTDGRRMHCVLILSVRSFVHSFGCHQICEHDILKQEAQLSQRDRATLLVTEYFAKSINVTQGHSK